MKGSMRILLLMMLFCIQNLFAQTQPVKPEQVFGMYFDAFVKQDERALQQLNTYLMPFIGTENTDVTDVKKYFSDEVQSFTGIFLANLPTETATVCKKETEEYFTALLNNLKNTGYKIKSIKEVKNEYDDDSSVIEINVDLSFAIPAKVSSIRVEDAAKMKAADLKAYLKSKTEAFAKPANRVADQQTFKLYQIKKDGTVYYWNGGPQELVWKLNEIYFRSLNQ